MINIIPMETINNKTNWALSARTKERIVNLSSYFFIILFIYAASSKMLYHQQFEHQVSQMPMFSGIAGLVAWIVPFIELSISALLLFNMTRLIGLVAGGIMLVVFTLYLVIILNFAGHRPYSDGGLFEMLGWQGHLRLNLVCIILCYFGVMLRMNSDYYKY